MSRKNVLTRARKQQAIALAQANRLAEAGALLESVCADDRSDAEAWAFLGIIRGQQGRGADAASCCRRAVAIKPDFALAHYNLGIALRVTDDWAGALAAFQAAVKHQPAYSDAHQALAHALLAAGRPDEAVAAFLTALHLQPRSAELHADLGSAYQALGKLNDAVTYYQKAQALSPSGVLAFGNLGGTLTMQGRYGDAIRVFRQGLASQPDNVSAHSNLLLTLNYVPDISPQSVCAEHIAWARKHEPARTPEQTFRQTRDPERILRIGYVSSDLRAHSVAYFIEPLLAAHDRSRCSITCYSDVPVGLRDSVTERLNALADTWREIAGLTHQQVADLITSDQIDVLVDLAGHTANNRLPLFALKPAPIQITYLGYPNTTGLTAMDYRFTDMLCDPPGEEQYYSERLWRLPGPFLCYQPPFDAPPVNRLPALDRGYVTFGSFNNLAKINPATIERWAQLLHRVPASRLLLKNPSLTDINTRHRYQELFARCDIESGRVELRGHTATQEAHLATYHEIDIALDPFPYNGTTTTCEALWMGVPVIALKGEHHAGRVGLSILTAAGLPEFVANDREDYIRCAVESATDTSQLVALRDGLRQQMLNSALCDGRGLAANIDDALRTMWARWCAGQTSP